MNFDHIREFFYNGSGYIVYALTGFYIAIPEIIFYVSSNFSKIKTKIGQRFQRKNLEKLSNSF